MRMLTIDKCPHGTFALALDDDEKGCGTRLTPTKCCGRWDRVKSWPMDDAALRAIANLILDEVGREA